MKLFSNTLHKCNETNHGFFIDKYLTIAPHDSDSYAVPIEIPGMICILGPVSSLNVNLEQVFEVTYKPG